MYILNVSNLSLCAVAIFFTIVSATGLNQCTSGTTKFSKGLGDWAEERGLTNGWKITNDGLVMTLEAPKKIVRMTNSSDSGMIYSIR